MTDDAIKPDQAVSATEHPLGKGEVVSSILTGSTRYARKIRASEARAKFHPATRDATKREHDVSTRAKSVEYVRESFPHPHPLALLFALGIAATYAVWHPGAWCSR